MEKKIACPKCGTQNTMYANFCSTCGKVSSNCPNAIIKQDRIITCHGNEPNAKSFGTFNQGRISHNQQGVGILNVCNYFYFAMVFEEGLYQEDLIV